MVCAGDLAIDALTDDKFMQSLFCVCAALPSVTVGCAGLVQLWRVDEAAVGAYFSIERSSRENGRRVVIGLGVAALTAELPEVVAALIGPIFRLYEWDVGADYVRKFLTGGRR